VHPILQQEIVHLGLRTGAGHREHRHGRTSRNPPDCSPQAHRSARSRQA
jgi:hypothetical protein